MTFLNRVVDTVSVGRNSYQGTPTIERPAAESGDLFDTLGRYSEAASNVIGIFGTSSENLNRTEPTSQPKPPGSAAADVPVMRFFANPPPMLILAVVAAIAGWFYFRKH